MDRTIIPRDPGLLIARIATGLLFLVAAYGKIVGYTGTTAYMAKLGVPAPAIVTPLVLIFELMAAIALLVGFKFRLATVLVAIFCVVAGVLAHWDFANQNQLNHLLKNIAIAGGMIAFHLTGPGRYSVDKN